MDGQRFDRITRAMARGVSRRGAVKGVLGGALAAALGRVATSDAEANHGRPNGSTCISGEHCASGNCDPKTRRCATAAPVVCGFPTAPCGANCCDIFTQTCSNGVCVPIIKGGAIAAAPSQVWRALTDPSALNTWLMTTDAEATVGHRFQLRTAPRGAFDGIMHGEVVAVVPEKSVTFTWKVAEMSDPATVTITLDPTDDGRSTMLTLSHTGGKHRGQPACTMAAAVLGRQWNQSFFQEALPRYLNGTHQG